MKRGRKANLEVPDDRIAIRAVELRQFPKQHLVDILRTWTASCVPSPGLSRD